MNLSDLVAFLRGEGGLPRSLPVDPMPTLASWYAEARERRDQPDPDAITIATVDEAGRPDARIVLARSLDLERGGLVFYTNRDGGKGRQLAATPRGSAVFHWNHVARQARLRGPVELLSDEESDAYFAARPLLSRIGAWASTQSRPLGSRLELVRAVRRAARDHGVSLRQLLREDAPNVTIPRPPHWGGYRLVAEELELWCGVRGRLHDRGRWTRTVAVAADGACTAAPWSSGSRTRLYP
jgi:pyridoxamine 5'-phosphate oxidase